MRIGLAGVGHQGRRYLGIVKPSVVLRNHPVRLDVMLPDDPQRSPLYALTLESFLDACDAVIVATPVESHYEIVRAAIDAGKRVLCEKPLVATRDELTVLEQTANVGQLTVGYTHLWDLAFEALRRACQESAPESVHCSWGGDRSDAFDWAPHAVAMLAALGDGAKTLGLSTGIHAERRCVVQWPGIAGTYEASCPNRPPLTRMVNWWLSGQRDYRSELWRRVEPAVLGLCGRDNARGADHT